MLLAGLAEAAHFLAGGTSRAHLRSRYPVELWLEIKVVLRGVEFLFDEVGTREGRHVAFVELVGEGGVWTTSRVGHKVLGAAKLVPELVRVRWPLVWTGLRPSWESHAHATHGVLVLVLFGHVL